MLSQVLVNLVDDGVSLIPVHATEKYAFIKWKGHSPLDTNKLWDLMDKYRTDAVAMVLGNASRRLCCLDIDVKHKKGIDAQIFHSIRELYPFIWDQLRIERTPSGGYHILYRIEEGETLPGCPKLASRHSTDEELAANSKEKTKCFIEIKCEGGLSQCYPSPGYTVVQDRPIPEITYDEHMSLVTLCTSYNEVIKVETIKPEKHIVEYYNENPYEHFDKSEEGSKILEEEGWAFHSKNGQYIYYSKPNKKTRGVSAGFNVATRLYTIWTASTEIDPKSYSPSNLLAQVKFDGDKKLLYHYLVGKGYGKIKEAIEKRIVKRAVRFGVELPQNISTEAKKEYDDQKEKYNTVYPYGIFWEEDDKGNFQISRESLYHVSDCLGFKVYGNTVCRVDGYIVERIEERDYFDQMKQYIQREHEDSYEEICNTYEAFLQKSGKFTQSRLRLLDVSRLLRSTKTIAYKAYKNGYVEITADNVALHKYEEVKDKLIWRHQIQNRDFEFGSYENGLYYQFLEKACGISDHLFKCIGYYAHDYKSTMTPYIVVLCEMVEDSRKGGGSGKNTFTNLLGFTQSLINKAAKNVKLDDTLLRTWNGEKILSLNDADKSFDYLGLREFSSGQWEVGKKWQQEQIIANEDLPKIMVNTNFAFDASQPGLERRLIPLEFSDFFTKTGGIDKHFGKDFPTDKNTPHDWENEDWIGFDNFIMKAIQTFIQAKCKLSVPELTDGGWLKQFDQKYFALTRQFIEENIGEWLRLEEVRIAEKFNVDYERFCKENNINKNFVLSSLKMNEALQKWCEKHDIEFIKSKNTKENNAQINVKVFRKIQKDEVKTPEIEEYPDEDVPF